MKKLNLVPSVQNIVLKDGKYTAPKLFRINFGELEYKPLFFFKDWLNYEETGHNADITFVYNENLHKQGYKICIEDTVIIEYSQPAGAFYALTTLKQVFSENTGEIDRLVIEDWPDIENRGVMLDVSRGRMTRIEVLKKMVDWLSSIKYNHFQLYFDAIVFDYKGLEEYTKGRTLYTVDEIEELNKYCKERFVELVPNQNSFGHMETWLKEPSLSHLAIKKEEDGSIGSVLNPLDPESLEFMDRIYSALLPHFSSSLVNAGCDETEEIAHGQQTKEECERIGIDGIYINYLIKLYDLLKTKYHVTPMFWADIILKYPDLVSRLPKDTVLIKWGYEFDNPFDRHCKIIRDNDLRCYVSPGTSTWNSFTGRFVNMLENLRVASEAAVKYNAEGYLLTDWGDGYMPQTLATCMVAYVTGSLYAWHVNDCSEMGKKEVIALTKRYADKFIFNATPGFTNLVIRLGQYCNLEDKKRDNATFTWQNFAFEQPICNPLIATYIQCLMTELESYKLSGEYAELFKDELKNICMSILIVTDPKAHKDAFDTWKNENRRLWEMRSKNPFVDDNWYLTTMRNYISKAMETPNLEVIPANVQWLKYEENYHSINEE